MIRVSRDNTIRTPSCGEMGKRHQRLPVFLHGGLSKPGQCSLILTPFQICRRNGGYARLKKGCANLGPQFGKIVKKAGLKPWPKVFHNLRASRETELADEYPIQVVCDWIGNSPQVASRHYLTTTEDHFQKAVHNPVQQPAKMGSLGLNKSTHPGLDHASGYHP